MKALPFASGLALGALCAGGILAWQAGAGAAPDASALRAWLTTNLGSARWLFLITLGLYGFAVARLLSELEGRRRAHVVGALEQLAELCVHVFVGIGVVWTAIGMRDALQAALADTGAALTDSAGDVLQALVDGGILLALSTTIVGGLGGYLMKAAKTLLTARALHEFHAEEQRRDLAQLIDIAERIEVRLNPPQHVDLEAETSC